MKNEALYFVTGLISCFSVACHADDEATFSSLILPETRIANSERIESTAVPGHGCIEVGAFLLPAPFGDAGMHEFVQTDRTPTTCAFHDMNTGASAKGSPRDNMSNSSVRTDSSRPEAIPETESVVAAKPVESLSGMSVTERTERAVPIGHSDPINNLTEHANKKASSAHYRWDLFVSVLVLALALLTSLAALGKLLYLRWFSERAILARAVRRGLKRNEFQLEYQPVFYIGTRKCIGLEVTLRWKNAAYGLRGEAWYMEKLVDRQSVKKIVAFVLSTVEKDLNRLANVRKLYLMVNLWKTCLESEDCLSLIAARAKSFAANRLVVQVNAGDLPGQLGNVVRLRQDKVRVAVSGVKSGTAITASALPVDFEFIKVDRDVMGLDEADRLRTLHAIAATGRRLDVAVIADGVEGSGQYDAVRRARIDFAQGFFLGKAIPVAQIPALFEKLDWWQAEHV